MGGSSVAGGMALGSALGVVIGLFLGAFLIRSAVRIVDGYRPSYGNACSALILSFAAGFALIFIMRQYGWYADRSPASILLRSSVISAAQIAIYAVAINDRNGERLGLLKAFLMQLVLLLFWILLFAALFAGMYCITGHKPSLARYSQLFSQMERTAGPSYSPAGLPATPSPGVTPLVEESTPAPVYRYFLKTPLAVPVPYGSMTIPANTEVRLLNQAGDSCRVRIGNASYTVSRSQLFTLP